MGRKIDCKIAIGFSASRFNENILKATIAINRFAITAKKAHERFNMNKNIYKTGNKQWEK